MAAMVPSARLDASQWSIMWFSSFTAIASTAGIASLLEGAVEAGQKELAVRIGYWDEESRAAIESAMETLREEREMGEEPYWEVHCYPSEENAGLVEFLLDAPVPVMEEAAITAAEKTQ